METLTIDDSELRLHRQGSGDPLLYLHSGYGEGGALPFFEHLAGSGFDVFAPLLPGFGGSAPVAGAHSVEDTVFHLRRVLDTLGLESPCVVGSSLGGWLACELAVWFPERVRALVLLDAFGLKIPGAPIFEIFGSPVREVSERALPHGGDVVEFIRPALADPDAPDAVRLHFFHALEATARIGWNPYLHDPRLESRLSCVTAPTLVVWGADDGIVPLDHGEAYAAAIDRARLVVLDRCGHLPVLERPAEVADLVRDLVASVPARG